MHADGGVHKTLPASPTLASFDVTLEKAKDGSLGINVRESALLSSGRPVTRVVGYKSIAAKYPDRPGTGLGAGPAEIKGYLREHDIICGVDGEDLTGASFSHIVSRIKACVDSSVRMRILRPEPFAILKVRVACSVQCASSPKWCSGGKHSAYAFACKWAGAPADTTMATLLTAHVWAW